MAGICDRYSSICHEKRFIIFFFSSKTDFLKGSFFFFQCGLQEKFSIAEIKKDNFQSLSKNFLMVESKKWEMCPPWQFEEYDVKEK